MRSTIARKCREATMTDQPTNTAAIKALCKAQAEMTEERVAQ